MTVPVAGLAVSSLDYQTASDETRVWSWCHIASRYCCNYNNHRVTSHFYDVEPMLEKLGMDMDQHGRLAIARPVVRLSRGGFTLIELLVVISIIAILISLLLPAMRLARVQARSVTCLSNQHQLVLACLMYYQDTGRLPAWWAEPGYPSAPVHLPFFGVEGWGYGFPARVELGSVWPYYQNDDAAFCPDWESDPELIQAGVIWPGTQKALSYGFNTLINFDGLFDSPYSGYAGAIPNSVPAVPDYFNEPGNTLWFMDSACGYAGNYILPPMWPEIYNFWPGIPSPHWWQTHHPSQRHMGSFNSSFLDGHASHTPFELYYDVGPASPSARYWGSWDN